MYNDTILEVYNCRVLNSSSTISAFYFDSFVPYSYITIENVLVTSKSSAIILSNVVANIKRLKIQYGAGIQVSSSRINGKDLIFNKITGNAVLLTANSVFNCDTCQVSNLINGPAINIFNSELSISNSMFNNIHSSSPGMVLYMNFCTTNNVFFNCSFFDCQSTGGALMDVSWSNLKIISSIIKENKSTSLSPGIVITNSNLVVANSVFSNQLAKLGAFINMATNCNVTVTSSVFSNGSSSISGGAISSSMSILFVENSLFFNNTSNEGGALYGITLSFFFLNSNSFEENSAINGASIYFIGKNISISNSTFYSSYNDSILSMIYTQNAEFLAINSSKLTGNRVPGIASYYTDLLYIDNSEFSNLKGALAAYSVTASNLYRISNTIFKNNQIDTDGSALMLESVSLSLMNTNFMNNNAESGGAIYFTCTEFCFLEVINNQFMQNSATSQGGAIYFECPNYGCGFRITKSSFIMNSAGIEGGSIK